MESITLSEIYKGLDTLKLTAVISHYFLLYIVLSIIQAALRVEVALVKLPISRRILTGALLTLVYLYGYSFFGQFSFF